VAAGRDHGVQGRVGAVEFGPGCRPAVPLAWQVRFEGDAKGGLGVRIRKYATSQWEKFVVALQVSDVS
jgi:hypothetical protein